MLVLCLDTATPDVAAALVDTGSGASSARVLRDPRGAGEHLMPLATACCVDAGHQLSDVGAVVVGLGPGPYTGLRVGVTTGMSLAAALDVPAHGACSLDLWATGECVVVTDARRREVFWARYGATGVRVDGPHVDRPSAVPAGLRLLGPGAVLAGADEDPRPAPVDRLASLVDPHGPVQPLAPIYLRRPDAAEPVRSAR